MSPSLDPIPNGLAVPPWARLLLFLLRQVPFSELVAIFFLLMLAGWIPSPWASMAKHLDEVGASLEAHRKEEALIRQILTAQLEATRVNAGTQRRICRNTATNPADRLACGD